MKTLISKLPSDKIKINWNKRPISMLLFKSFLTVETVKSTDHLGASTGWTQYRNDDIKLVIGGGIVGGVDLLDRIEYGTKLQNPYNDYVNPFYLKSIMTKEGIEFFKEYYAHDIQAQIINAKSDINRFEAAVISAKEKLKMYNEEIENLSS